jgi:EAL domain-containing protein (putative c-di-GMP-specific phosphodiesterase class I)
VSRDQTTRWLLWSREWSRERASGEYGWDRPRRSFSTTPSVSDFQPGSPDPQPAIRALTSAEHARIRRIVDERLVTVEFQPIRDVSRSQVVGFEALPRGPAGPLHSPDRLFAAAAAAGLAGQLDWVCRAEAFRTMLAPQLPPSISLFVNVEPDSLIEPCPDDLLETVWQASTQLRVFIDVTARSLTRYPTQVLETVRRARAAGWGVSVADVEFSAGGLALLPTLEPDVLKLTPTAVTSGAGLADRAVRAVLGESEQTGAVVMLERIEDDAGLLIGRGIGAIYQSGHRHGRPDPLPKRLSVPLAPIPLRGAPEATPDSPWDVLAENGAHISAGASREALVHLLRTFTNEAAAEPLPPVIAVVLPDNDLAPTAAANVHYSMLLQRCPLVLVAGRNARAMSDWHVRAGNLPTGHRLLGQLCFAALSPTLSMALVARPDPSRPAVIDIAVTHQPALCRQVIRNLIELLDTLAGGVRQTLPS